MRWHSIRELYEPGEQVALVYDRIERKKVVPVAFANTELFSKCNLTLRLSNGHIVVDDCSELKLDGRTFHNEDGWRRVVGLEEDMEIIDDLFGPERDLSEGPYDTTMHAALGRSPEQEHFEQPRAVRRRQQEELKGWKDYKPESGYLKM